MGELDVHFPAQALDDKGRCCGRKPIRYMRDRHLFCPRCDRSYDFDGKQITNWAFKLEPDGTFSQKIKAGRA